MAYKLNLGEIFTEPWGYQAPAELAVTAEYVVLPWFQPSRSLMTSFRHHSMVDCEEREKATCVHVFIEDGVLSQMHYSCI